MRNRIAALLLTVVAALAGVGVASTALATDDSPCGDLYDHKIEPLDGQTFEVPEVPDGWTVEYVVLKVGGPGGGSHISFDPATTGDVLDVSDQQYDISHAHLCKSRVYPTTTTTTTTTSTTTTTTEPEGDPEPTTTTTTTTTTVPEEETTTSTTTIPQEETTTSTSTEAPTTTSTLPLDSTSTSTTVADSTSTTSSPTSTVPASTSTDVPTTTAAGSTTTSPSPRHPDTGSDTGVMVRIALLAIGAGFLTMLVARRRA